MKTRKIPYNKFVLNRSIDHQRRQGILGQIIVRKRGFTILSHIANDSAAGQYQLHSRESLVRALRNIVKLDARGPWSVPHDANDR